MSKNQKLLDIIATCDDEKKLRNWISNANREGAEEVEARSLLISKSNKASLVLVVAAVGLVLDLEHHSAADGLAVTRAALDQLEAGLIQRDAAKYLRRITDICVTEQCSLLEWDMLKSSLSERDKWAGSFDELVFSCSVSGREDRMESFMPALGSRLEALRGLAGWGHAVSPCVSLELAGCGPGSSGVAAASTG